MLTYCINERNDAATIICINERNDVPTVKFSKLNIDIIIVSNLLKYFVLVIRSTHLFGIPVTHSCLTNNRVGAIARIRVGQLGLQ